MKFAISAAVLATVAFVIPAQAEQNYGALTQNGQCWKAAPGPTMAMGHWEACAQPASATTTATPKHKKHSTASR